MREALITMDAVTMKGNDMPKFGKIGRYFARSA